MKPELSCCDPKRVPFPSGWNWAHADTCRVNPKQKVNVGEDHPARWTGRARWWEPVPYQGREAEIIAFKAHSGRLGS